MDLGPPCTIVAQPATAVHAQTIPITHACLSMTAPPGVDLMVPVTTPESFHLASTEPDQTTRACACMSRLCYLRGWDRQRVWVTPPEEFLTVPRTWTVTLAPVKVYPTRRHKRAGLPGSAHRDPR